MKHLLATLSVILILSSCQNNSEKEPVRNILGEWDSHEVFDGKSFVFLARFKADGTFDGLSNGKLVISGQYRVNADTIFFKDAICNLDYEASYKLTWFKDSIRFNVINDTCQERIKGSDKVALGRVAR